MSDWLTLAMAQCRVQAQHAKCVSSSQEGAGFCPSYPLLLLRLKGTVS